MMRMSLIKMLLLLVFSLLFVSVAETVAQSDEFNYQGSLKVSNAPANGNFDFEFRLFNFASGGSQVGVTWAVPNVVVTNGVFNVSILFEDAFDGQTRYMETRVRPAGVGAYTTLSPRNLIGTVPYALRSRAAFTAELANSAITATNATNVTGVVGIANGGTGSSSQNFVDLTTNQSSIGGNKSFTGTISGNGSGLTNLNAANVATGILPVARGGTGSSTQNFVDLTTNQTNIGGNKTFTGILTGNGSGLTNVPGTVRWNSVAGTTQQALANNGYIATNASQTIITLPTSPQVGDVVRVSGAGTGGWRINQNAGQSIVATTLNVTDEWIPRDESRIWHAVASSDDGSKLIAVGSNGAFTSSDFGVTWVPRQLTGTWTDVASSSNGSKLIALVFDGTASDGRIFTSIDSGVTWTPRETLRVWQAVASSADGNKLVAVVGGTPGGRIYTSIDSGVTWTPRDSVRDWDSVASSSDGVRLAAVVGGGQIYTSSDSGVTWTPRDTNRQWASIASSADGSRLAAVELSGRIFTSADFGVTWIARESSRLWSDIASSSDGSKLVAVNGGDFGGGRAYISTDFGVTWIPKESNRSWSSVAVSSDGTKVLASVGFGLLYTANLATTTGVNGGLTGAQFSAIELLHVGSGRFIVLSYSGPILSVF